MVTLITHSGRERKILPQRHEHTALPPPFAR